MPQPEVTLARRITVRRGLVPPVPVQALVQEKADLHFAEIPADVDGLCVDLKVPGRRPRVFVNSARSWKRIRFTLAHEYGHLQIPWHMGTTVDITDDGNFGPEWFQYVRSENEANAFASELLLPRRWLSQLCVDASVAEVHRIAAQEAEVSRAATAIALVEAAPAGCLYAQVREGIVVRSKHSPGTISRDVPYGARYANLNVPNVVETGSLSDSLGTHVWWKIDEVTKPPKRITELPWREIQAVILQETGLEVDAQKKLAMRINGVVSSANSKLIGVADRTTERLFTGCVLRLSEVDLGPGTEPFRRHPLFLDYIRVRAEEFISRDAARANT